MIDTVYDIDCSESESDSNNTFIEMEPLFGEVFEIDEDVIITDNTVQNRSDKEDMLHRSPPNLQSSDTDIDIASTIAADSTDQFSAPDILQTQQAKEHATRSGRKIVSNDPYSIFYELPQLANYPA